MSRNRFQILFRFFHFSNNEEVDESDRIYKIRFLIDHFNKLMQDIYALNKDLCIDESVMSWKGRLFFRVYIKNKKHRYGIKIYKLCESNGVILKIKLCKSEGQEGGQTIKVVTDLLDDYLNKGYKVYTDNYYNSVELTRKMSANKTYLCGTLQSTRKGNPKVVTSAKLMKGEMIWRRKGEVAVCKWKDKRDVLTILNMHNPEMITIKIAGINLN
ncbi:unnamed protein product [Parnassius mnemosyne]|uniref:PiggyBac transposable element-derived protein domain-containing protein n=1 Tax=Parnassius mnemosyne TaxID=213953 RepID=A0AAV1L9W9_9NEOP